MQKKLLSFIKISWFTASICLLGIKVFGQTDSDEIGFPAITNYSVEDYQGHARNWSVLEDEKGIMYFGNNFGVLEYDGVKWRMIDLGSSSFSRSFAKDSLNRIFVGGFGNFGYLEEEENGVKHFKSLLHHVRDSLRSFNDIWNIHITPDGIYYQARERIFLLNPTDPQNFNGSWTVKTWEPRSLFLYAFYLDGVYYIHQRDIGLMKMVNGELELVHGGEAFADDRVLIMFRLPGPVDQSHGKYIVGKFSQGLFIWDGQAARPFSKPLPEHLQGGIFYKGLLSKDNRIMINILGRGIVEYDLEGNFLNHIGEEAGLQDIMALEMYEDSKGAIWLGLDNGISRIERKSPFSYYDKEKGIISRSLSIERFNGNIYVGTTNELKKLNKDSQAFENLEGSAVQLFDIQVTSKTLLATTISGLYYVEGEKLLKYENPQNIGQHLHLLELAESSKRPGLVYAGALDGLYLVDLPDGFRRLRAGERYIKKAPNVFEQIWTMVEDKAGNLWLGTARRGTIKLSNFLMNGDIQLDQIEIQRYSVKDGLGEGGIAVFNTSQGPFFTNTTGVYRYNSVTDRFERDSLFSQIQTENYINSYVFKEDHLGRIWINFGKETVVAIPIPGGGYDLDRTTFLPLQNIQVSDILIEKDSVVWFTTAEGVIRYDETLKSLADVEFDTYIRRIHAGGEPLALQDETNSHQQPPSIQFKSNTIKFEFASANYDQSKAMLYKTRLLGLDEEWSEWLPNNDKEYLNLTEGDYEFQIRAKNLYNKQSNIATYEFSILPPWYRSNFAYFLYFLVPILLVTTWYQWRMRIHKRKLADQIRLNKAMYKFVPSAFLKALGRKNILDVQLGDIAKRNVTVFFSDIRDFTSISEKMTPEQNFSFVSNYNGLMGPIIQKNNGFVNQYLGDGIMAIFPHSAVDALRAAVQMQTLIQEINAERDFPIRVGMGLHTGQLVMGITGDDDRYDAATISDTVNTASRIENTTKYYGAKILLSEQCYTVIQKELTNTENLEIESNFNLRYLGRIQVKGKEQTLDIFECFDGDDKEARDLKILTKNYFEKGIKQFLTDKPETALTSFKKVITLNPNDEAALKFHQRILVMKDAGVPENWTGVEEMRSK